METWLQTFVGDWAADAGIVNEIGRNRDATHLARPLLSSGASRTGNHAGRRFREGRETSS
jgi:hypothetical protein